jgi:hypothetical protein
MARNFTTQNRERYVEIDDVLTAQFCSRKDSTEGVPWQKEMVDGNYRKAVGRSNNHS